MRNWIRRVAACLLAAAAGCDADGPVEIYVLSYDNDADEMRLAARTVETIESVSEVRGAVTRLVKEPSIAAEDGSIRLDGGEPATALFTERSDGALVPEDWDSLLLLSYYHHLEASVAYFESLGVDTAEIVPLPSYYRLEYGLEQSIVGLVDNAAYVPSLHAFFLFDPFFLDQVPLAANDGVVTHELGHAVFHRILNGDERESVEYRENWPPEAVAHLGGLHEGQSDVFAAMQFDEPDFFRFSVPQRFNDRDMEEVRTLTPALVSALGDGSAEPHQVGAVIASAIWRVSETVGRDRAAEMTLAAEEAIASQDLGPDFRISDFLVRFVEEGDAGEQAAACEAFCDQFDAIQEEIDPCACP